MSSLDQQQPPFFHAQFDGAEVGSTYGAALGVRAPVVSALPRSPALVLRHPPHTASHAADAQKPHKCVDLRLVTEGGFEPSSEENPPETVFETVIFGATKPKIGDLRHMPPVPAIFYLRVCKGSTTPGSGSRASYFLVSGPHQLFQSRKTSSNSSRARGARSSSLSTPARRTVSRICST